MECRNRAAPKIVGRSEIADEAARLDRRTADYLAKLDDADGAVPLDAPGAMMTGERFQERQGTRTEMVLSVLSYNMLRAIKLEAACLKAKEAPVKPEPPIVSTQ